MLRIKVKSKKGNIQMSNSFVREANGELYVHYSFVLFVGMPMKKDYF